MFKKFIVPSRYRISGFYSFFEKTYDRDYAYEGEIHNFWEIVCVLEGRLGVTADKDVYILEEGQAIVHKPMEFHNIWSESSNPRIIILSFSGKIPDLEKRIFTMDDEAVLYITSILGDAENAFHYDSTHNMFITGIKEGRETLAEQILKKCELFVMSLVSGDAAEPLLIKEGSAKSYMNIVSFLNSNTDKSLSVYDIAKALNMSEPNVKKVFKKYSGMGVIHYFNTLKINKAQNLLKSGMSVKEVSERVGFSDQNYFSTVFKRITGISPKKYKDSY